MFYVNPWGNHLPIGALWHPGRAYAPQPLTPRVRPLRALEPPRGSSFFKGCRFSPSPKAWAALLACHCHRLCHPIIRDWVANRGTWRDDRSRDTNQINPPLPQPGCLGRTRTLCKTVYPGSIPGVASTLKMFSFNVHYLLPVLSNRGERLDNFCSPSVRTWMSSAWRARRCWSAALV
jgi:hypothetical protein